MFCVAISCRFYEVNNVNHFQFSRGVQKGEVKKDNEFSVSELSQLLQCAKLLLNGPFSYFLVLDWN